MPPTLTSGGQTWTLERGSTTTIGRQDTCDIVIRDASLSRAHVTITVSRDKVEMVDNHSANGTFVNGIRLASAELKDGDVLKLGVVPFEFRWPESVVQVTGSPVSAEKVQAIKQSISSQKAVTVDWKTALVSAAAMGAGVTGIVAGLLGGLMQSAALFVALAIGALGGIFTAVALKAQLKSRVADTLTAMKDDLDLFYTNQKSDVDLPGGFPELVEVVHSIRLGNELTKDRTANEWRMKLHEAQMALQAREAMDAGAGQDRGFMGAQLGLDDQFRVMAWNGAARALFKPGIDQIQGVHLLQLVHNAQLGTAILNAMANAAAGAAVVLPNAMISAEDGRPLDCLVSHPNGAPASYRFVVQFVPHV